VSPIRAGFVSFSPLASREGAPYRQFAVDSIGRFFARLDSARGAG
jgi:hypothetical protein